MPATTIFDRFESDENNTAQSIANDLSDLLGARRLMTDPKLGVLSWGLPSMIEITSRTGNDKRKIARYILEAITAHEPRLEDVQVIPMNDAADFRFRIEAKIWDDGAQPLRLRILAPHVGGGLGGKRRNTRLSTEHQ